MPLNVLTGQSFNISSARKLLGLGAVTALALVLSACGNSGDPESSSTPNPVQGNAVKGVIANGVVRLYYQDTSGHEIDLGQTRTDARGNFALDLTQPYDDHVTLVEISSDANTSMLCDRTMGCQTADGFFDFAESMPLPAHFKLLGIVNTETGAAFVSPLSHLIIQTAQQNLDILTPQALEQASEQVQQAFELEESPLLAKTPDLTNLEQEEDLREAQLKQAILSAALFEQSMSPEWSQNAGSLDSLELDAVVLDASVISGQLLDMLETSHGQYVSAVASISEDTTEQYQALTYQPPAITSNPISLNLTEGDAGSLSVTVNGTGPFTYQWYKDAEPVSEATAATLNFSSASLDDAGIYFVEVADAQNSTRSLTAVLDVAPHIEPIAITAHPQSQTLTAGVTLTLEVSVNGDAPLYQWQRNGTDLPNGNNQTYAVSNIQLNQAGNYRVIVRNSANSVISAVAQININEPVLPVNITSQPSRQSVMEGGSASFSVAATGTAPITYQWRRNGSTIISGATGPMLTLSNVQLADDGTSYDVLVTNPGSPSGVRSAPATLDVSATPVPARIETQPAAQALTEGQSLLLQVSASGDAPIRYQWFKNNVAINGATGSSLNIASVSLNDAGSYAVEVQNSSNTEPVRSNSVTVTVDPVIEPVVITTQPAHQSVMEGGTVSFSVTVSGTAPITYQWRRDGSTIIAGTNGSTLTLSNVSLDDDNSVYDVLASNAGSPEGVRSNSARLNVSALPVPARIETQPTAQTLTEGQPLLLQVSASGDAPIRYQWVKGGVLIPGATGPSYGIANVTLADSGDYYATVENNANTQPLRSNTATVVVTEALKPASISRQPENLTVTAGDSATFRVDATGGGFLTYQWYKTSCNALSGTPLDQANASSLTLSPVQLTDAGAYCVRVTNGAEPPAVSTLASLTVLPSEIPVSILTQPLAQTVPVGDPVTLSVVASGNDDLSYQWFKDNNATPVYTGGSIFNMASTRFEDAGAYRVTVRNTNGESSVTSNEVIVRVEDRPSLLLSWSQPQTRVDGSALDATQIHGYVIQYGFAANNFAYEVTATGADTVSQELVSLPKGNVYVRIATVDSNKQQGPFSTPVAVVIP